jgi:hypothetical protein
MVAKIDEENQPNIVFFQNLIHHEWPPESETGGSLGGKGLHGRFPRGIGSRNGTKMQETSRRKEAPGNLMPSEYSVTCQFFRQTIT